MSSKKSNNETTVFDRIMEVKNIDNLSDLADFLGINYSTLRNQKSRKAIPYDNIVSNMDGEELLYVLKGDNQTSIVKEPTKKYSHSRQLSDLDAQREGTEGEEERSEYLYPGENDTSQRRESPEITSHKLIQKVNAGPWYPEQKLRMIDIILTIAQDAKEKQSVRKGEKKDQKSNDK